MAVGRWLEGHVLMGSRTRIQALIQTWAQKLSSFPVASRPTPCRYPQAQRGSGPGDTPDLVAPNLLLSLHFQGFSRAANELSANYEN